MKDPRKFHETLFATKFGIGIFEKSAHRLQKIINAAETPLPKEFYCRIQEFFLHYLVFEKPKRKRNLLNRAYSIGGHFVLFVFSLFSIISARLKRLQVAHYVILIKNQKHLPHDFRSNEIIEILPLDSTVNFAHCASIRTAFSFIGKIDNLVFLDSILYFCPSLQVIPRPKFSRLDVETQKKISDFWPKLSKSRSSIWILRHLCQFLRLKKFIMLDDSRHTGELRLICKTLGISSIGYMHGRFNEFHMGLFYYPFDKYFVWSEYFKELFLKLSPDARVDNVFVTGHFRIKDKLSPSTNYKKNPLKVLILGESNVPFEEVRPYIDELIKAQEIVIKFRGKPGLLDAKAQKYFDSLDLAIDDSKSLIESLVKNQFDVVVGTHSTALMECFLQATPGLILSTTYDYAADLVREKKIFGCDTPGQLIEAVKLLSAIPKSEIEAMATNLWGKDYTFKPQILVEHLLN